MFLPTHLAQVPDFCQPGGNFRHKLLDVLVIRVLAVLSGADDFVEMACFAERKLPVLRRYLSPEQGPPSHDTFRRVVQHLDAARFNAAFLGWVRQLPPAAAVAQARIDGKTLRGRGPRPRHLVSALARAEGLCLAQVAGAGKGHKRAALPEVLGLLDLSGGALVSLDALGCQPGHCAANHGARGPLPAGPHAKPARPAGRSRAGLRGRCPGPRSVGLGFQIGRAHV